MIPGQYYRLTKRIGLYLGNNVMIFSGENMLFRSKILTVKFDSNLTPGMWIKNSQMKNGKYNSCIIVHPDHPVLQY